MTFALALVPNRVPGVWVNLPQLLTNVDRRRSDEVLNRLLSLVVSDEVTPATQAILVRMLSDPKINHALEDDQGLVTTDAETLAALVIGSPEFQRRERMCTCIERTFLPLGALTVLGLSRLPAFLIRAACAQEKKVRRKVLIAIFQRGAVDGLSMLVPHGERAYYDARKSIAIRPPQAGNADTAVDLDGFFALHPALAPLKPLWAARRLAVVHACGSPHPTRSHFDAQDYMESGTPGEKSTGEGWLARVLEARPLIQANPFRAVAFSTTVPQSLQGKIDPVTV